MTTNRDMMTVKRSRRSHPETAPETAGGLAGFSRRQRGMCQVEELRHKQ
jgi:hypothetical protein